MEQEEIMGYQTIRRVPEKRNDISQSRLFNGYSVRLEKGIKDLPLLRSFSSPALWPLNLGKGSLSVTESSTPVSMPSPDILFSKPMPFQCVQPVNYQSMPSVPSLHHHGTRMEKSTISRHGFQTEPFKNTLPSAQPQITTTTNLPLQPLLPTTLSTSSSTLTTSTAESFLQGSLLYDHSIIPPLSYDHYGYTTQQSLPETKEKINHQWLNDSDPINGSSQNSTTAFISTNSPAPTTSDNSLQDSSFQESVTNLKNTTRTEDGVIPSAIVVKNIPFQIKKEQLLELFDTLDIPKPYAFNYHFDNGNFRGLAFANFYTPEETTRVILSLNGHDIMGRKLRVEYKRVLPVADRERIGREKKEKRNQYEEHNSSNSGFSKGKGKSKDIDLNDEATLKVYSRLLLFRNDQSPNAPNELIFPPDLNPQQRRIIHLIAEKLGLKHTSCGENSAKYIVVNRSDLDNINNVHKNFWNGSNFGISDRSASPIASLPGTNLASVGMPSITSNFFENSHTDSRVWSKPFNDIRTVNTQIPSKTHLHQQVQPFNIVTNTSFDLGASNLRNDLNVMMQDLNLDVTNKQTKNTEWVGKKEFKNMGIKTSTD